MNRIPFSVYDFFGYLASGFVVLVAVDYGFEFGWLHSSLSRQEPGLVLGIFFIIVAYITGQIIANVSGHVLESWLVRGILQPPEETLFLERPPAWRFIFPGFYRSLPKDTQARVASKVKEKTGTSLVGPALFFHCHPLVKREQATLERLNTFLNLYGFCRNVSMSLVLAAAVLVVGVAGNSFGWWSGTGFYAGKSAWAGAAVIGSIGLFYRYLKFFREYTVEVFRTYAELE